MILSGWGPEACGRGVEVCGRGHWNVEGGNRTGYVRVVADLGGRVGGATEWNLGIQLSFGEQSGAGTRML